MVAKKILIILIKKKLKTKNRVSMLYYFAKMEIITNREEIIYSTISDRQKDHFPQI